MRIGGTVITLSLVLAIAAGCAKQQGGPVATVPATPVVDVAALIRHGCFSCLERALEAASGEPKFEAAALLTLRAKELGLPYEGYRRTAGELATVNPAFTTYLEVLDAAPVDPLTGERYVGDDRFASATRVGRGTPDAPSQLSPGSDRAAGWKAVLASPGAGSALLRSYLSLVIECRNPSPTRAATARAAVAASADAPLLRYRAGICDAELRPMLLALRQEDADYVDADYMLGRSALAGQLPDLDEALARLESAVRAFPESLAAATVLGDARQEREEWAEALDAFDSVIKRAPQHRDALLGRTIALSRLKRHDDAIATATRMIELGSWFLGEAHYWRAWNAFNLQQYPAARLDTDRAKSLMVNAAVFVLSGLVEWNERRLPTAESEFEEALKMDFGRCDAARYLGRVRVQRSKVPEALAAFKQAIQCYDLSIAVRQKMIADVTAASGTDAMKARRLSSHQRAIAEYRADREEVLRNVAELEKRGTQ
jgi:tetratricopeptide (TPR) repeat protein